MTGVSPRPRGGFHRFLLASEAEKGLAKNPEARSRERGTSRAIEERLAFEIKTIVQMGFAGYFLIVARLHQWEKVAGGGRGRSGARGGRWRLFLGITDLDPLR